MNPSRSLTRRINPYVLVMAAFFGWLFLQIPAVAKDAAADDVDNPLVVINAASFQRLRDNAGVMFESEERKDMTNRADAWSAGYLRESKGIDRTQPLGMLLYPVGTIRSLGTAGIDHSRPFGMMVYLRRELIGAPLGILYLPVKNLNETLQTLAYGIGSITAVEGRKDRHEIHFTPKIKLQTLYRKGYLFVVGPDGNETSLDWKFPDPEKLTARLTAKYDIAVSFMINSVPNALRSAFVAYFKTQSKAELQQRDDEPESAYRLRRANGEFWIELIEKIINQGNEVTLGVRVDNEQKLAYLELEIAGARDGKLAKLFQNMVGKRTYFGNLLASPSTLTMSLSWLLEDRQRNQFVNYFDAVLEDLSKKPDKEFPDELAKVVDPIFKSLMTSAEVGHLDAFAQMTGNEPGEFAFVSGVKLATSHDLPKQIENVLQFLKDHPRASDLAADLELGFDTIDALPVHRLPINPPDQHGQRMFGEVADVYLYATSQAVWIAFGGDVAFDSLREAVEAVAKPQDPKQHRNRVPFQFVSHVKSWLSVTDTESPNTAKPNEPTAASIDSDNDALRIDLRPTDSGMRLRIEFESGFLDGIESEIINQRRRAKRASNN